MRATKFLINGVLKTKNYFYFIFFDIILICRTITILKESKKVIKKISFNQISSELTSELIYLYKDLVFCKKEFSVSGKLLKLILDVQTSILNNQKRIPRIDKIHNLYSSVRKTLEINFWLERLYCAHVISEAAYEKLSDKTLELNFLLRRELRF